MHVVCVWRQSTAKQNCIVYVYKYTLLGGGGCGSIKKHDEKHDTFRSIFCLNTAGIIEWKFCIIG